MAADHGGAAVAASGHVGGGGGGGGVGWGLRQMAGAAVAELDKVAQQGHG
jgi:hypothetical protein